MICKKSCCWSFVSDVSLLQKIEVMTFQLSLFGRWISWKNPCWHPLRRTSPARFLKLHQVKKGGRLLFFTVKKMDNLHCIRTDRTSSLTRCVWLCLVGGIVLKDWEWYVSFWWKVASSIVAYRSFGKNSVQWFQIKGMETCSATVDGKSPGPPCNTWDV